MRTFKFSALTALLVAAVPGVAWSQAKVATTGSDAVLVAFPLPGRGDRPTP